VQPAANPGSFHHISLADDEPSVMVSWLPLFHDMGLIGGALQPLYAGFPSIIMSPTDFAPAAAPMVTGYFGYRGTTTGAPNFAYEHCVRMVTEEQKQEIDLSSSGCCTTGGANSGRNP